MDKDYFDYFDNLTCPACQSGRSYGEYLWMGLPMRTEKAQMLHCMGIVDLPVATCTQCSQKFETDCFPSGIWRSLFGI